ncbi:MAG: protein kinase [Candidatus Obscuribacterales bacterium]|nr:protein kinase [Candidatus Obscuribacterales bacterium]
MAEGSVSKCPKCGGNIDSRKSGSITQWVVTCACSALETYADEEALVLDICPTCKKRVGAGRAGSLTQWIFRSDLCSCGVSSEFSADTTSGSSTTNGTSKSQPGYKGATAREKGNQPIAVDPERFPIERFTPIRLLGSGSGGTVYLCIDTLLDKTVAVKTLNVLQPEQLVAFQGEARAASKLNHPNVIKVFDFGVTSGGLHYMVMEFVGGKSVSEILEQEGTVNISACLYIFSKVCDGLAEAHKQGIFHRDVKSANIIVGALDGRTPDVRIIDFGVASVSLDVQSQTVQGVTLVGTPAYMSPDQAQGRPYDVTSEVYSVGCTLFEALTGSTPFRGESALEIINQHAHSAPPKLSQVALNVLFPKTLEDTVAKCLSKLPDQRYQSMEELHEALNLVATKSILGKEESLEERPKAAEPEVSKKAAPYAAVALVALITVVGAYVLIRTMLGGEADSSHKTVSEPTSKLSLPPSEHFQLTTVDGSPFFVSTGDIHEQDLEAVAVSLEKFDGVYILAEDINGSELKHLSARPLKFLYVNSTPLNHDGFSAIASIRSLEKIELGDLAISENDMAQLSTLPNLKVLDLANSRPSAAAVKQIAKFPNLKQLSLSGVRTLRTEDLQELSDKTQITGLNLSYTPVGKQDSTILSKFKTVTDLSLISAGIKDDDLANIEKLPLRVVHLDRNQLTPKALDYLIKLKDLKLISMKDSGVTARDIGALKAALPNCTIKP